MASRLKDLAGRPAIVIGLDEGVGKGSGRSVAGVDLGSAVQRNPLTAVAWLAHTLGEFDIPFLAGEVILSGSLAPLIPVSSNRVALVFRRGWTMVM